MITVEKLYEQTNQGLDIILYYYPQAAECTDGKKKFKIRASERTPSAVLKIPDQKHAYYRVCDYGDEGHAISPVDVAMKEECYSSNRFFEIILLLGARHNVTDEINRSINKPRRETRAATKDEKDGDRPFRLLPRIPEAHLKIFGPNVKHEHTDFLHWHEAEYIGYVKDGKCDLKYSTENYPIFMRECVTDEGKTFYKIYEPLNPDKGFRFTYAPKGVKPAKFINGFRELEVAIMQINAGNEPEDKPIEKIPEAYICSGERDAICCLSMGGHPLWFNSETYDLSEEEYHQIMDKVQVLYNIPDIDSTGRKKGEQLALRYMDIKTIWLPETLATYRDNRGKARKDLRDWMEIFRKKSDFNSLKKLALHAKFWEQVSNAKTGKKEYSISSIRLYYFLQLQGFHALHDDDSDACRYIRIDGNIVSPVRARDVRKFVREWAEKNFLSEQVRNLIVTSMKFSESSLENLKEVSLDFTNYTPTTQTFFFKNCAIVVSGSEITEYKKGDSVYDRFVWEENVIPHNVKVLPPLFTVERDDTDFNITINDSTSSPFFGYLINSSRLYWRKEMEQRFLVEGETTEALARMEDYKYFHKFCLDGDGLSEEEIAEQKLCLLNKLFTIGYMLHHYKSPSRPWAPIAMDNKIGDQGECNGRSGKSFLFKTLSMFMKSDTLSGRNPKLMENPHVFERVNKDTDMVLIDDCAQYLPMGLFYDLITSDMTVNPKNNRSFSIPFKYSPKFAFSTNFVPADFDSSSVARSLYVVFSDYYHEMSDQNDYRETRKIADDFGGDLYDDSYSDEKWNADINVLLQCEKFYLSLINTNIKIQPPMDNIVHRKNLQDMGANFQDWAEFYFAPGSKNLDTEIVRREALDNYCIYAHINRITTQAFTKKLKAYCAAAEHIACYNPPSRCNNQGRIVRYINNVQEDMIFIESVKQPVEPQKPDPQLSFLDNEDEDENDDPYHQR